MNRKKWIGMGIVILVIIVLVFGSKQQGNINAVRIGLAIPLTGNYASIGENIKNGMEMAKSDIEAKNKGTNIELIYQDACLPKDITSAVQKLISTDKVNVINQFCAIGLVPSMSITEPAKVISVGVAANVDDLLGKKYYFSPNFAVRDNAKTIADFAVDTLKAKKVAFIYYNTQFGKDYRKYIGREVSNHGGTIVGDEMTSLDVMDFRTNLVKIRDAKPDVIFVTQLTGALGTIIKQTRDLGMNIPIVGNYQNEDPIILSIAGKAAEGFIISSADPSVLSPDSTGFRSEYRARFGREADAFAANAYDALNLEYNAYTKCNGEVECMRNEIHKVVDYKGVSGTITIDENGVASKPTVFKIVKDGKFVNY